MKINCCKNNNRKLLIVIVGIVHFINGTGISYAAGEFELNFQPQAGFEVWNYEDLNHVGNSNAPNISHTGTMEGTFDGPFDTTPMIYETGIVNGQRYIHQVIGDPASGFAMEIYIKAVGDRDMGPITFAVMDSGGSVGDTVAPDCSNNWYFTGTGPCSGNNADPLRANDVAFTGNGTGNPTSVEMRMVMGGSWDSLTSTWSCDTSACFEFYKDLQNNKPKITNNIVDNGMSSEFIIDMSGLDYSSMGVGIDAATDVVFSNAQIITGPSAYGTEGDFSMVSLAGSGDVSILAGSGVDFSKGSPEQDIRTSVSAGRYTYTPGAGWNNSLTIYDMGAFSYLDSAFDQTGVTWIDYCEPGQNEHLCIPWMDMVWRDRNF